jgi:tricorn protease
MLYALQRPLHAVTVPRGGEKSYPLGYLDYPFWDKPIIVLCNQNTSSNGEIFCHAIKSMKRGKLVGAPTAGSVISVYSNETILDIGDMSVPFRGWYVIDNKKNMEGNGAQPDVLVWPKPKEIPSGDDKQLKTAVKLLLKEVQ